MKNFIQDAFGELSHVVWPTKNETRDYFKVVSWALLISIIVLFIVRYGLGEGVFLARNAIQGEAVNADLGTSPTGGGTSLQVTDSDGNAIEGLEVTTSEGGQVSINGQAVDGTDDEQITEVVQGIIAGDEEVTTDSNTISVDGQTVEGVEVTAEAQTQDATDDIENESE